MQPSRTGSRRRIRRATDAPQVFGTHWHGLFDNDAFRRKWLDRCRERGRRNGFVVADDVDVAARRDAQLDVMADLLASHLDVAAITELVHHGAPPRPTIVSALATDTLTGRTEERCARSYIRVA